jgi:hypothetical protein
MEKKPTLRQGSSVACLTRGVAGGKRRVLAAGGLRNEPRADRKHLTAEAQEKNQVAIIESPVSVPKQKEKDSYAAILARVRKELAKPHFTKSVREKATKKQIASWIEG